MSEPLDSELYFRNEVYEFALPALPNVHIVETSVFEDLLYLQKSPPPFNCANVNGEYGNLDFLPAIDIEAFWQERSRAVDSWKYDYRRTAQAILPFIYLGPFTAARDIDFLTSNGITMTLGVRHVKSSISRLLDNRVIAEKLGIESKLFDVTSPQQLIASFTEAIASINNHMSAIYNAQLNYSSELNEEEDDFIDPPAIGKVLLFCESGNDSSATLATAYMMAMFGFEVNKAAKTLLDMRLSACYDIHQKHVLQSFADILAAKRSVCQARRAAAIERVANNRVSAGEMNARSNKRSYHEFCSGKDHDGDEVMKDISDDIDDTERFAGRPHYAPFM